MDTAILVGRLITSGAMAYFLTMWGIDIWKGRAVADPRLLAFVLVVYGVTSGIQSLNAGLALVLKSLGV